MENKVYITDESANFTTIRDPMVMLVGDTYYVTGTQPPYWKGVNDGVRLLSSKDLKTFTDHGLVIKREDMPEDMWCRDRFWAPEIFDGKNGWFYITFNCRNEDERYAYGHSVGVARARKPEGPYEIVTKEKALHHGNDATIFLDDDGKAYIGFTCADKLVLYRFDLDTCEISEEQVVCYKGNEGEWDSIGVEGQCIVKRHGIYFQWYSSWTNGYAAGVLTSDSIHGPWKKAADINPIISENELWYRAGHNHSFKGLDGKDYVTFHCFIKGENEEEIERFIIRPVEYHPDGTVTVG